MVTRSIQIKPEDIMFEENYGDIVRNELYKNYKVFLVMFNW